MAKKSSSKKQVLVGLVMGSDSDWPVLKNAVGVLKDFGVESEVRVLSAHRTPDEMLAYAKDAESRGLKVIIAGAGGAAHLPGMIASATALPVIGVPINITKLDGLDSFLSIVQMPKGVPVATVAIDGAINAALLAVRMLATHEDKLGTTLRKHLKEHKAASVTKVKAADKKLRGL